MAWDDRQIAMLAEMGVRLWLPARVNEPGDAVVADSSNPSAPPAERGQGEAGAWLDRQAFSRGGAAGGEVVRPKAPVAATGTGARPAAVETMDWPALATAIAVCTACELCRGRTQTVFGAGPERAHWMIDGEAPDENEDRQGEPFVGKAGQLLDNILLALGLGRGAPTSSGQGASPDDDAARRVFLTHALKCRTPTRRTPLPHEIAQCEHYLRRQVAVVRPRIILAMGRLAVQSLLRSEVPIGKLRGRLHAYEGVPLVVTYPPAYLLRNPADKARAWEDLCLARSALRAAGPAIDPPRSGA